MVVIERDNQIKTTMGVRGVWGGVSIYKQLNVINDSLNRIGAHNYRQSASQPPGLR